MIYRALCAAVLLLPAPSLTAQVLINEVDADQAGQDTAEFVELYDGGAGATALANLVLVFFNGSSDASYRAVGLDGHATDAAGFFVLCNDAAQVPGCHLALDLSESILQNGPDAVALYTGTAADFPSGTPIQTSGLVDAVVYGTADPDDAELLTLLLPGEPQVDEDAHDDKENESIQRSPDGAGGARVTHTYVAAPPTPGGTALPVELAAFVAVLDEGAVTLSWRTLTETQNAGFEVQHATGRVVPAADTSWRRLAFVPGAGTTVGPQSYRYQHRLPEAGTFFYRLRQVDFDGRHAYSPVRRVDLDADRPLWLSAPHPNPSAGPLTVRLRTEQTSVVTVRLTDALGRLRAVLFDGLVPAHQPHVVAWSGDALPGGVYFVHASSEHHHQVRPFVLRR